MPVLHSKRLAGTYRDSVVLMKASQEALKYSGAHRVVMMMGTPRNKEILANLDLATEESEKANPDELIVTVETEPHLVEQTFDIISNLLNNPVQSHDREQDERSVCRNLEEALHSSPDAQLTLISVPGEYARYEVAQALVAGLDVMLYSGDISLEDERTLKSLAVSSGHILMGPDCGTAIINHVPIGFANNVRSGTIGIISSSGTGIQEVTCLLDRCGLGVSKAFGTGGRDLLDSIGGITARAALKRLVNDPETRSILMIGREIGTQTRERLLHEFASCGKPVLVCYLGETDYAPEDRAGILHAPNLTALARMVTQIEAPVLDVSAIDLPVIHDFPHQKGFLRAIYSGGALCQEAASIAMPLLTEGKTHRRCSANFPMSGCSYFTGTAPIEGHAFVDMGAPEFTGGRPHPLLNPASKMERILVELCNAQVSVVLTDIVLGSGVAQGQASDLVRTKDKAAHMMSGQGRKCVLVTSVCGTDNDPVSRSREVATLQRAGILVAGNNASAALIAARLANGGTRQGKGHAGK